MRIDWRERHVRLISWIAEWADDVHLTIVDTPTGDLPHLLLDELAELRERLGGDEELLATEKLHRGRSADEPSWHRGR